MMCVVFVALVGSRLYTYKYKFRFKFNIHEVWTRQEIRRSSGGHSSVRIDHFSLIVAVLAGVIVVVVVVVLWTWPRRYGG